jgi:uncharacterized membrane protein (UPF0136 family)
VEAADRLEDTGAPAVVGIAAMIGLGKAAFEGLFGIIGFFAADSVDDGFGTGALIFAVLYAVSAWLMLRGNRVGMYVTVVLSAIGLVTAIIYVVSASDVVFMVVLLIGGLNALVLYLLLGTRSAREYFTPR